MDTVSAYIDLRVGLAMEFRSKKILRNSFLKVLISRHSEVYGRFHSKARNGTELHGKISFMKKPAPENRIESMLSSAKCFGTEFWEDAPIFVSRSRIPSCSLFPGTGMVRNRIPSVCLYFCTMEWNSELFLPRNGSERNSDSLLLFLFPGQNFEHFSPLQNGSERNSKSFLFF
jgi:hypothetical protein